MNAHDAVIVTAVKSINELRLAGRGGCGRAARGENAGLRLEPGRRRDDLGGTGRRGDRAERATELEGPGYLHELQLQGDRAAIDAE